MWDGDWIALRATGTGFRGLPLESVGCGCEGALPAGAGVTRFLLWRLWLSARVHSFLGAGKLAKGKAEV